MCVKLGLVVGIGYLVVEEQGDEVGEPAVEGAGDAAHQREGVLLGGETRNCEEGEMAGV